MSEATSKITVSTAPISRVHLDRSAPFLRVIVGIAFVAYCSISTITGINGDFARALAALFERYGWPLLFGLTPGLLAGILAATIIFIGEIYTAERAKPFYGLFLGPDAWYTYWSLDLWLGFIVRFFLPGIIGIVAAAVIQIPTAISLAYFGERLLFGKRRK